MIRCNEININNIVISMADVTINDLTGQAPVLTDIFPFSTTGITPSTYKATLSQIKSGLGLATVATTGSYNDLTNKPTIPLQSIAQVIFSKDSSVTSIANSTGYLSTNITIQTGSKVLIQARITMSGSGSNYYNVAIQRNGSNIDNAINDSYGYTENVTFAILDDPGVGTHTYRFYNQSGGPRSINRDSSGGNACFSTILLQEIKGV